MDRNVERNYGIDALKVIITFFIIVMHLINCGIGEKIDVSNPNYYLVWFIESITYVSVNCYGLISGYLNVNKDFKVKKIIKLWLIVFFYTFGFTLLFQIFKGEVVSIKLWVKAFIPFISNYYWYFTAYFVLYLLMPFLNFLMNNIKKNDLSKLVIILIIVFSLIPTLRGYDLFLTGHGFSVLWLTILYIIGGYIKLYVNDFNKKRVIILNFICIFLTVFSKYVVDLIFNGRVNFNLYDYTSITVLIESICLFVLFMNLRKINVFSFLSKFTFGIYIIHVNYFVWNFVLKNNFRFLVNYNIFIFLFLILIISFLIFVICFGIEFLRDKLFKLVKVDDLIKKIKINL